MSNANGKGKIRKEKTFEALEFETKDGIIKNHFMCPADSII